jgi:hypothetical protein
MCAGRTASRRGRRDLHRRLAGADRPEQVVDALLPITDVFGTNLRDSMVFRDLLVERLDRLSPGSPAY